ncbi:tetratricopeptide repeat protein [Candidatus Woesearchaeota archaeon]|nr:tetratricopeptide repeat protein [Candidatus Woesearchaeota archaeon]
MARTTMKGSTIRKRMAKVDAKHEVSSAAVDEIKQVLAGEAGIRYHKDRVAKANELLQQSELSDAEHSYVSDLMGSFRGYSSTIRRSDAYTGSLESLFDRATGTLGILGDIARDERLRPFQRSIFDTYNNAAVAPRLFADDFHSHVTDDLEGVIASYTWAEQLKKASEGKLVVEDDDSALRGLLGMDGPKRRPGWRRTLAIAAMLSTYLFTLGCNTGQDIIKAKKASDISGDVYDTHDDTKAVNAVLAKEFVDAIPASTLETLQRVGVRQTDDGRLYAYNGPRDGVSVLIRDIYRAMGREIPASDKEWETAIGQVLRDSGLLGPEKAYTLGKDDPIVTQATPYDLTRFLIDRFGTPDYDVDVKETKQPFSQSGYPTSGKSVEPAQKWYHTVWGIRHLAKFWGVNEHEDIETGDERDAAFQHWNKYKRAQTTGTLTDEDKARVGLAIDNFRKVLEVQPDDAGIQKGLAHALIEQARLLGDDRLKEEGRSWLIKSLAYDPNDAETYLQLAHLNGDLDPQKGIWALRVALHRELAKEDTTRLSLYAALGNLHFMKASKESQTADSLKRGDQALEARLTRASGLYGFHDAERAYDEALRLAALLGTVPQDSVLELHKGKALSMAGAHEDSAAIAYITGSIMPQLTKQDTTKAFYYATLGHLYARLENPETGLAIESYRSALAITPDDWALRNNLAENLIVAGHDREAIAELATLAKTIGTSCSDDPKGLERGLRTKLGNLFTNLADAGAAKKDREQAKRDYLAANEEFSRVVELDPHDLHAWNTMGYNFLKVGARKSASSTFGRSLADNPGNVVAYHERGNIGFTRYLDAGKSGDLEAAIHEYEKGLSKASYGKDRMELEWALGNALYMQGKVKAANGYFAKAFEKRNYMANRGKAELGLSFATALEKDGWDGNAGAVLSYVLGLKGIGDDNSFEAASLLSYNDLRQRETLLKNNETDRAQGKLEDAKRHLSFATELRPGSLDMQFQLGNVLVNLGEDDAAIERLMTVAQNDPSYKHITQTHTMLGTLYAKKGEYEQAKNSLSAAVTTAKTDTVSLDILNPLALSYHSLDDPANAITVALLATQQDSANVLNWKILGYNHDRMGNLDDAVASFEQALAVADSSRDRFDAELALGHIFMRAKEQDKAFEHFMQALTITAPGVTDQELAGAYHSLGHIHYAKGEYGKALDMFDAGLTHQYDKDAHVGKANALVGLGQYQAAADELTAILAQDSSDVYVKRALGYAQLNLKRYDDAQRTFMAAQAIEPDALIGDQLAILGKRFSVDGYASSFPAREGGNQGYDNDNEAGAILSYEFMRGPNGKLRPYAGLRANTVADDPFSPENTRGVVGLQLVDPFGLHDGTALFAEYDHALGDDAQSSVVGGAYSTIDLGATGRNESGPVLGLNTAASYYSFNDDLLLDANADAGLKLDLGKGVSLTPGAYGGIRYDTKEFEGNRFYEGGPGISLKFQGLTKYLELDAKYIFGIKYNTKEEYQGLKLTGSFHF